MGSPGSHTPTAVVVEGEAEYHVAVLSRLTDMSIDDATGTIGVGGGAPPRKALTAYMGHASITITLDRYGHLLPGGEDEAADLLDRYLERGASRG